MRRTRWMAAALFVALGLVGCGGGQGPTQPDIDPEAEQQDGMSDEQEDPPSGPDDPSPQQSETDEFGEEP